MSTVNEITSDEAFEQHLSSLSSSTLLVLSFHTPWAAPCAQMNTVLTTLASSYPVTDPLSTSWISVNAEDLPDVSDAYDVTAVPYLVLIKAGKVLETVSGSDASKVRTAIERHANAGANKNDDEFQMPAQGSVSARNTDIPAISHEASAPAPASNHDHPHSHEQAREEPQGEMSKEDLHKRLSELVKAAPVMLFMKGTPSAPQCGFSRQLVGELRKNSVRYGFFNILADDEVRQGLKEFADWPTFPQLWVNGELVGGLDIVKEEFEADPEFLAEYAVKA